MLRHLQGATSALEGLVYKRYRPQTPLIKCALIANRSDEFLYPLLALMKGDYPIVTIQTYPKFAMSSHGSPSLFWPTNIKRFSQRQVFSALYPSTGHGDGNQHN
jgi:hypothetical protein